jgi:hypothetical protein
MWRRAQTWRSTLVDSWHEGQRICRSFLWAIEELPETLEGLPTLVTDLFWKLFDLGVGDRTLAKNPALWADGEVGGVLSTFFNMQEFGLDLEAEHWSYLVDLRARLTGEGLRALARDEESDSLLNMLARQGLELHNPAVRLLIERKFNGLVAEVSRARCALQASCAAPVKTVLQDFWELSSLTGAEINTLMQDTREDEREGGASRRIAAQLAGGRCGLEVSSVLKYAQPGRPKESPKKQN